MEQHRNSSQSYNTTALAKHWTASIVSDTVVRFEIAFLSSISWCCCFALVIAQCSLLYYLSSGVRALSLLLIWFVGTRTDVNIQVLSSSGSTPAWKFWSSKLSLTYVGYCSIHNKCLSWLWSLSQPVAYCMHLVYCIWTHRRGHCICIVPSNCICFLISILSLGFSKSQH